MGANARSACNPTLGNPAKRGKKIIFMGRIQIAYLARTRRKSIVFNGFEKATSLS